MSRPKRTRKPKHRLTRSISHCSNTRKKITPRISTLISTQLSRRTNSDADRGSSVNCIDELKVNCCRKKSFCDPCSSKSQSINAIQFDLIVLCCYSTVASHWPCHLTDPKSPKVVESSSMRHSSDRRPRTLRLAAGHSPVVHLTLTRSSSFSGPSEVRQL